MKLWQYNTRTGYWDLVRTCEDTTAQSWLKIFQQDNPTGKYKLSKNRPNKAPKV